MMKGNDQSKVDEEKPVGLTLYKPEDQIFQNISVSIWENYMKPLKTGMNMRRRKRKSSDATPVRNVNNTYLSAIELTRRSQRLWIEMLKKKGRVVYDSALNVQLSNLSFTLFTFHIRSGSELEIKKDKIS